MDKRSALLIGFDKHWYNTSHNLDFSFKAAKVCNSEHKMIGPSSPVTIKSKEGKSINVNEANKTLIVFKLWFKTEYDVSIMIVIAYSFVFPIASCKYIIGSGTGFKKYKIKAIISISVPVFDNIFKFALLGLNISSSIDLFIFGLILKNFWVKLAIELISLLFIILLFIISEIWCKLFL